MLKWARTNLAKVSPESYSRFIACQKDARVLENNLELRGALLDFIADFANWDSSTDREYLQTSRALTHAAHLALGGAPGTRPLVVDPFAGGGSIPLEALRVGAEAFASDLNPVPVLLNKVVLEYVPKYGERLADEVQKSGEWIRSELERELEAFYPKSKERGDSNAYIWARTILSEAPSESAIPIEVPLLRSMLLLKKKGRYRVLRWKRDKDGQVKTEVVLVEYADGTSRKVRRPLLEITEPTTLANVDSGTSSGGAATCPVTGFTTSVESVRRQLKERKGGALDARLICVVTTKQSASGKSYLAPNQQDIESAEHARDELKKRIRNHREQLSLVPDGELHHLRGFFNVVLYGMTTWGDLFTHRQALGLTLLAKLVRELPSKLDDSGLKVAVQTCLALTVDRCADKCASLVVWDNTRDMATHVFGRQALPMIWDFAEVNLLSDNGWDGALEWVLKVLRANVAACLELGTAVAASATAHPLPSDTADAIVTDPPYYAAIPYADLSDFFYSWLKRSIGDVHAELFRDDLSPKDDECVSLAHRAAMYRQKDNAWFERKMTEACEEARRIAKPNAAAVFVFANKETAGWEAMLKALISASWVVTASWPIDTEMGNRLRAQNSAVLASSVHLVCRPREMADGSVNASDIGDWRDVLQELPGRIHEWMPRLADEGIAGADAIFACLGPALEIFSRYSRVERANGETVTLKEYLEQVWGAVANEALALVFKDADALGLEADARLTAMWLWTLQAGDAEADVLDNLDDEGVTTENGSDSKKDKSRGFALEYDAARKIAQGLGAHLEDLGSLVEISGETAKLLPVAERAQALFGKDEGGIVAQRKKRAPQLDLFSVLEDFDDDGARRGATKVARLGESVLDRIHQGMLLFAAGRGEALKRFLVEDGVGRDHRFWSLAQALSALYPPRTDEKRWVDGVLARKKSLGF